MTKGQRIGTIKRTRALSIAKEGFRAAMRRAHYVGNIGEYTYQMDRDDWAMNVHDNMTGEHWVFPVAKSWEP